MREYTKQTTLMASQSTTVGNETARSIIGDKNGKEETICMGRTGKTNRTVVAGRLSYVPQVHCSSSHLARQQACNGNIHLSYKMYQRAIPSRNAQTNYTHCHLVTGNISLWVMRIVIKVYW